ncbi:DUF1428 domain-containing protein [Tropicimonas sediminicola]|uniref:Uncharacterized conserved protein YbaA, DUF1428 family n=1 Tax=Tropicimonas sediminicola TaxID=1031541 RepID=A0A239ESS5_9RHOB|nr:DUF1428 domain-containing protein [Tropicimonas sediminicola]SNS46914.1 Uncharacterized conserved protein YbaA, DUF1428 family [Tropicimonas sediminicola]
MTYVAGFVQAVPEANKAAYLESARRAWPLFKDHGAVEMRECWGDAVPDGELTSFPMAVKAEPGETVVFSWVSFPDKATHDACMASMESDARWQEMFDPQAMPFDMKRMIFGGFEVAFEGR